MKKIRLFLTLASIAALMSAVACNKQSASGPSIDLSIKVTNVTAINAVMDVTGEGEEPALVRLVAPVHEAEVLETVGSLDNADAVKNYISSNGEAIDLPYNAILQDLDPETAYFAGVIAYNSNMDIMGYATSTFTTRDLASLAEDAVGDPSDAGSLDENELK